MKNDPRTTQNFDLLLKEIRRGLVEVEHQSDSEGVELLSSEFWTDETRPIRCRELPGWSNDNRRQLR